MIYFLLGYLLAINIVAIIATVYDKGAAKRKKQRISEKSLLLIGFLGGAVAMYLTMQLIRHKTRRLKFMLGLPLFTIIQIVAFIVLMPSGSNNLMAGASPENSALAMYVHDGENIAVSWIFDADETRRVLDDIENVALRPAAGWSAEDVTFPIYGLQMGNEDGGTIFLAWSNGFLIAEGNVYQFDFDFAALAQDSAWRERTYWNHIAVLPYAHMMALSDNQWNVDILTVADEPEAPEHIVMTILSWQDNEVHLTLENQGTEEWIYGEGFSVQVEIGGAWYDIPYLGEIPSVIDIGLMLFPGEVQERNYNLTAYGQLPAGTYRIIVSGVYSVQVVE